MKEIWHAKVAIMQNVKFQHAAPLGVNPLVLRAFLEEHYFFSKFWKRIEGVEN